MNNRGRMTVWIGLGLIVVGLLLGLVPETIHHDARDVTDNIIGPHRELAYDTPCGSPWTQPRSNCEDAPARGSWGILLAAVGTLTVGTGLMIEFMPKNGK